MAEGGRGRSKSNSTEAWSAGIESHGLNPRAVRVMAEAAVDIRGQRSNEDRGRSPAQAVDLVVTIGGHAHETGPTRRVAATGAGHVVSTTHPR